MSPRSLPASVRTPLSERGFIGTATKANGIKSNAAVKVNARRRARRRA
jgi:hypothetical protein